MVKDRVVFSTFHSEIPDSVSLHTHPTEPKGHDLKTKKFIHS